jgi:hypothetical protein
MCFLGRGIPALKDFNHRAVISAQCRPPCPRLNWSPFCLGLSVLKLGLSSCQFGPVCHPTLHSALSDRLSCSTWHLHWSWLSVVLPSQGTENRLDSSLYPNIYQMLSMGTGSVAVFWINELMRQKGERHFKQNPLFFQFVHYYQVKLYEISLFLGWE